MKASSTLANRFREVMLSGTWIANTNFKDQLTGLDWKPATTNFQPLNTIADLAQHIHYYIAGLFNVFNGGDLEIRDKYSFDFPPIESQKDWEAFLAKFWQDAEAFAVSVEQMSDTQLQSDFVDKKYGDYQRNIEAMIEHAYYHLGQIVILKKILSTGT